MTRNSAQEPEPAALNRISESPSQHGPAAAEPSSRRLRRLLLLSGQQLEPGQCIVIHNPFFVGAAKPMSLKVCAISSKQTIEKDSCRASVAQGRTSRHLRGGTLLQVGRVYR